MFLCPSDTAQIHLTIVLQLNVFLLFRSPKRDTLDVNYLMKSNLHTYFDILPFVIERIIVTHTNGSQQLKTDKINCKIVQSMCAMVKHYNVIASENTAHNIFNKS